MYAYAKQNVLVGNRVPTLIASNTRQEISASKADEKGLHRIAPCNSDHVVDYPLEPFLLQTRRRLLHPVGYPLQRLSQCHSEVGESGRNPMRPSPCPGLGITSSLSYRRSRFLRCIFHVLVCHVVLLLSLSAPSMEGEGGRRTG